MKTFVIVLVVLLSFACNSENAKSFEEFNNNPKEEEVFDENILENIIVSDNIVITDYLNDVMLEEDILFNGKLKRYFTLKEFENVFGKADSTLLMSEEEPCSYIFDNEDGTKDMQDTYLYKDGSRFEKSKQQVAVDEFRFTSNNFILYKGKLLDSSSTIMDLQEIFPNALKSISRNVDNNKEKGFESIILMEDENGNSDGHIRMFIKNDKLYSIWWWFPC